MLRSAFFKARSFTVHSYIQAGVSSLRRSCLVRKDEKAQTLAVKNLGMVARGVSLHSYFDLRHRGAYRYHRFSRSCPRIRMEQKLYRGVQGCQQTWPGHGSNVPFAIGGPRNRAGKPEANGIIWRRKTVGSRAMCSPWRGLRPVTDLACSGKRRKSSRARGRKGANDLPVRP